jgi:hypothetical protein
MTRHEFIFIEQGVGDVLLIALAVYAWARGGTSERVGATIVIVAWVVSWLAGDANPATAWIRPQYGVFVVDVLALGAFIALALRSDRFWPLTTAGAQLLAVAVHIGYILDPRKIMPAYISLTSTIGYLILVQTFCGIWLEVHRLRGVGRNGPSADLR